jgi:hydrogenase nickel incorporation protein HypA/HybF
MGLRTSSSGGYVHELSIAQSLIELASESALAEGVDRVEALFVRIGRLSGVVREALEFSFELAAEETPCEGASLEIEDVPITVRCAPCDAIKSLADGYKFCCPTCGTPTSDIVTGRELDLVSIRLAPHAPAHS